MVLNLGRAQKMLRVAHEISEWACIVQDLPTIQSRLREANCPCCAAGAAVNALSLVEAPYAWLENHACTATAPDSSAEDSGSPTQGHEAVLTLHSLRQEYAIACAGVALGLAGPDACRRRDDAQLQQQLLAKGGSDIALLQSDTMCCLLQKQYHLREHLVGRCHP